jgi:lysophospholipase L1-like esterase
MRPGVQGRRRRAWGGVLEALEPRELMAVGFDYAMAERFGQDLNHNGLIDLPNTATYARPTTLNLTFSVLDDPNPDPSTLYSWSMQPPGNGSPTVVERTAGQIGSGNLPTVSVPAGTYSTTFQRIVGGTVTDTVTQPVNVRDILIVSLGDSYSSGEANPEVVQGLSLPSEFPSGTIPYLENSDLNQDLPALAFTAVSPFLTQTTAALWADGADGYYGPTPFGLNMTEDNRESHRSTLAATAQYALQLERSDPHSSVTFVHVAQSGATTQTTIGAQPAYGKEDPNYVLTPQTKLIPAIVGTRPIDQLFISLGGNDVGFTTLAAELVVGGVVVSDVLGNVTSFVPSQEPAILAQAQQAIANSTALGIVQATFNALARSLPAGYASVQKALSTSGITVNATFITEYPDPTLIYKTFTNPSNGQPFTIPWWGPAAFDIVPPAEVSATEAYFVSQTILPALNGLAKQGAAANGWTYLGNISSAFLGHGYDAPRAADSIGNLRFIRTARESSLYQGPVGLTGPLHTSGTLHPNALGHQAIKAAILGDLSPSVRAVASPGGALALARPVGRRNVRNAGLSYAWDFDRLPGQGAFRADAFGARTAITGHDPDPTTPGRVATLRVTNRLGITTEKAVFLPRRRPLS